VKRERVWAPTLQHAQGGEQTFNAGLPEREARAESAPTRAEERLEGSRAGWALLAHTSTILAVKQPPEIKGEKKTPTQ